MVDKAKNPGRGERANTHKDKTNRKVNKKKPMRKGKK